MATIQVAEETTLEATLEAKNLGKPDALKSDLWKNMIGKFLKGEPKVLGVVQIMIALISLSFGAIMKKATDHSRACPISLRTGYLFWGALMFMISGSLSLAAGIKTTKSLVQGVLVMNVISSVLAAGGILITSLSCIVDLGDEWRSKNPSIFGFILFSMDIILLVLSVLEFCISVSNSAFACKVACCCSNEVVLIMQSDAEMEKTASNNVRPQESQYDNAL